MRVVVEEDAEAASRWAAERIASLVRRKPNAVLGLATGGTPIRCYAELIRLHQEAGLDFSQVRTFNLDEYVGLAPDHPQSYRRFMEEQLFDKLNIPREQTHVPNGLADDFEQFADAYEQQIREAGGIDLQLLGIGRDGHIAFNEPGSSLASRTRLKCLTQETIDDNARFFEASEEVPSLAVTMGVGTILEARECLLLAAGSGKASAIRLAVEGPVSAQVTASALQLHRRATIVLDAEAAAWLQHRDYYDRSERAQRQREVR